jgi:hypothetical protein
MKLYEITGTGFKNRVWEKFRKHHYTPERWNPAARVFIATEVFDGKEVIFGMTAALSHASGTVRDAWCSHKVVVLPSGSGTGVWMSPERILLLAYDKVQMWRTLADTEAELFIKEGYRYFCNAGDAPPELIAYRNDPLSGWVPTSKNGKPPRDGGHGQKYGNKPRATNADGLVVSHWYLGTTKLISSQRRGA